LCESGRALATSEIQTTMLKPAGLRPAAIALVSQKCRGYCNHNQSVLQSQIFDPDPLNP